MRSVTDDLLLAVAAGRVVRDSAGGARRGAWELYLLDGAEVGMGIRQLRKRRLVDAPMIGPPRLTEDGAAYLRAAGLDY